jgi:clan AA aspartic protease (TIGR02281 family)
LLIATAGLALCLFAYNAAPQADSGDNSTEPTANTEPEQPSKASAENSSSQAAQQPSVGQQPPQRSPTAEPAAPFLPVFDNAGKPLGSLLALAPEIRGQQHYCCAAKLLPTTGLLHTAKAEPLDFQVIIWDRSKGLVLLVGPTIDEASETVTPLIIADSRDLKNTDPLTAISPAGRRWADIYVEPHTAPLVATQRVPQGSVLVNASGRAIALMGQDNLLPLSSLTAQQKRWRGTDLSETQKQIRATDPQKISEDVQRLIDNKNATLERVEEAIQLLQQSQHLALDRQSLETFDTLMRWAHHQRIRLLTAIDGNKALQQALASYQQFHDHPGIHSDVVLLLLQHGDPMGALHTFQLLQATASEQAKKITGQVAQDILASMRSLTQADNIADLISLGAQAVQTLPQRADLRMAYAQALLKAGNRDLAQAEALEAVRLQPSYQNRLSRMKFRPSKRGSRNSRTVVIPFNPQEKQIRTRCAVGVHNLEFIVDTGASYTTVPRQIAQDLGLLSKATKARVQTANGPVDTLRVVLPSLTIAGQIHLKNVPAMILNMGGNIDNNGLLGLDVLQGLNMRIDSDKCRVTLRQSPSRRNR